MTKLKIFFLLAFLFFSLSLISASCNSTQVDINSASLSDLDKLSGVGTVKAQAIIDSRPFNIVDDLLKVKGIGNVTLNNIKTQGLACVSSGTLPVLNEGVPDSNKTISQNKTSSTLLSFNFSSEEKNNVSVEQPTISLNPQVIKTDVNKSLWKGWTFYGLLAFFGLVAALFAARKQSNKNKNEFR